MAIKPGDRVTVRHKGPGTSETFVICRSHEPSDPQAVPPRYGEKDPWPQQVLGHDIGDEVVLPVREENESSATITHVVAA